ncbi:hypothetical protein [Aquibacillus albus]|uniref:Uncharacterized protein n=1 Tax=Aquibacillus albus TaxID=1168171 RepID=A0ABS2N5I2_9BACI|nr:hypothetical protein [Aquibacillus albus]MBM7573377.1 hypothetical protein [Aquibacillus albus]
MVLSYITYILFFGAAFFASYKYVTYMMKNTDVKLTVNMIVASMINLLVYSLAAFGWVLHALQMNEAVIFNGIKLGFWLFLISEMFLITTMLYKYRKNEIMSNFEESWKFTKTNSLKVYEGLKKVRKISPFS